MTRIIPRRNGHFIIFFIIGIVLSLLLSYYASFAYELVDDTGSVGGMLSVTNSNAKLVFTNFCTYEAKCEAESNAIGDGIYSGSLSYSDGFEDYYRNYEAFYDGSEEDILKTMRHLMGGGGEKRYGYFSVVVKKGKPVQGFWCIDEKLLYYTESLAKQYESLASEKECAAFYTGGAVTGGYPIYNTDYKTKPSGGYISSLPARMVLSDAANGIVKVIVYAVMIFSPLLLMLAVSVFIHRFYTKDEYRQNAKAVFEAAKIYLSECRNVIPDRVYSGVLKACENEPEICFDGSAEDISAFMANIAADCSKNYYSIKIQNCMVTESRFSISRRLLKGAECGGIYLDPLKK